MTFWGGTPAIWAMTPCDHWGPWLGSHASTESGFTWTVAFMGSMVAWPTKGSS